MATCRWLDESEGDKQTYVTLYPVGTKDIPLPHKYQITVFTSDIRGAGTDANVDMTLFGTNATISNLKLENSKNNFERNMEDIFFFELQDLGSIPEVGSQKRSACVRLTAPICWQSDVQPLQARNGQWCTDRATGQRLPAFLPPLFPGRSRSGTTTAVPCPAGTAPRSSWRTRRPRPATPTPATGEAACRSSNSSSNAR
jgi:hypothetical protein